MEAWCVEIIQIVRKHLEIPNSLDDPNNYKIVYEALRNLRDIFDEEIWENENWFLSDEDKSNIYNFTGKFLKFYIYKDKDYINKNLIHHWAETYYDKFESNNSNNLDEIDKIDKISILLVDIIMIIS